MDMQSTLDAPTKPENPTRVKILDVAEQAIIQHGYKSMSFRDVAAAVGIKSASVHYHFPTKGDLAAAVMRRHRETFEQGLKQPKKKRQAAQKALNKFIDAMAKETVKQDVLGLSTVLTAEKSLLDKATKAELMAFYELKMDWLSTVVSYMKKDWMPTEEARAFASQILASLHGATVVACATGKVEEFELAVAPWRTLVDRI
ncbi:TetR/AcrR family transcriptional regulator [Marinomonas ostreistagni]|uniref:TetR/AcrR family transcriptional regulator n=1 Tax=Marinomonas ostreistagni TaxID=359209 RepID=A0ABS0ZDB6_9GAMM|nr:TetR/AcrR family transcriptional regulator [Marinomonas ostreistagni]MBJ7551617.1 TetR/AcrR family transcriptional regulator [Marinomonas ostreistagni]